MLKDTALEGHQPQPSRSRGSLPGSSPAPNVLAAPCDGDGVHARNHGVILKAIDAIPQVFLLHTLLTLCPKKGKALGLPSSSPGAATAHPSCRPTYWDPSQ